MLDHSHSPPHLTALGQARPTDEEARVVQPSGSLAATNTGSGDCPRFILISLPGQTLLLCSTAQGVQMGSLDISGRLHVVGVRDQVRETWSGERERGRREE